MIPLQEFHFYLTTAKNQPFAIMTEIKKADSGQFSAWTGMPQELPTDIIVTINSISISTIRGIMFSTFKGTYLHNAFLPIIDPKSFNSEM